MGVGRGSGLGIQDLELKMRKSSIIYYFQFAAQGWIIDHARIGFRWFYYIFETFFTQPECPEPAVSH